MFYLVEEFFSLQGEGRYAGYPSYFLRIGGCNLRCEGFGAKYSIAGVVKYGCDTYFAVDRDFAKKWQKIDDVKLFVKHLQEQFAKISYTPHVVITGGEPLLYFADSLFYEVFSFLITQNIKITFETNCSLFVDFEKYPLYKKATYAMSIKLSNSGEPKEKRVNQKMIEQIVETTQESFFKFTIDKALITTTALEEISEICANYKSQIYCMPIGETKDMLAKNDKMVFDFCKQNGFIYSDRLHIRIFDTTQGV